jgi:hypothetical protein
MKTGWTPRTTKIVKPSEGEAFELVKLVPDSKASKKTALKPPTVPIQAKPKLPPPPTPKAEEAARELVGALHEIATTRRMSPSMQGKIRQAKNEIEQAKIARMPPEERGPGARLAQARLDAAALGREIPEPKRKPTASPEEKSVAHNHGATPLSHEDASLRLEQQMKLVEKNPSLSVAEKHYALKQGKLAMSKIVEDELHGSDLKVDPKFLARPLPEKSKKEEGAIGHLDPENNPYEYEAAYGTANHMTVAHGAAPTPKLDAVIERLTQEYNNPEHKQPGLFSKLFSRKAKNEAPPGNGDRRIGFRNRRSCGRTHRQA